MLLCYGNQKQINNKWPLYSEFVTTGNNETPKASYFKKR